MNHGEPKVAVTVRQLPDPTKHPEVTVEAQCPAQNRSDCGPVDIAALQTEVLRLALAAPPGSHLRVLLSETATFFPALGFDLDAIAEDPRGSAEKTQVEQLLDQVSDMCEARDDLGRSMRSVRNSLERCLDKYIGRTE